MKINLFKRFSLKAEADFLNKLSLYLSANISIVEALRLVEDETNVSHYKSTFSIWREGVESGKTLAQATTDPRTLNITEMSRQAMVLGDRSGALAQSLKEAQIEIKKTLDIKKKITAAIAYPVVILLATIGLITGLLLFVFPKIIPIFETLKVKLPLSTRMLIWLSQTISDYWFFIVPSVIAVFVGFHLLIKFSSFAKKYWHYAVLRLPLAGPVFRMKILCSSFDFILTLIRGGEQLDTALVSVAQTVKFAEYKHAFAEAGANVTQGKQLSHFLKNQKRLFPIFMSGIISVGERTGHIESSIRDISEIIRDELENRLRIFTAAIEPALMISMSAVVAFIALSIILPIYGITTHFQSV